MTKVVLNDSEYGFSLSKKAIDYLEENNAFKDARQKMDLDFYHKWLRKNPEKDFIGDFNISRDNPVLIHCIELLKKEANSCYSNLKIVEYEGN